MKQIMNKILILLWCSLFCVSCNYLDIVPDEKATEEDAFKNAKAAERYLYSCYAYIPDPRLGNASLDLLTGDEFATPWDFELSGQFVQGNYTPSNPCINYWNDLYKGIRQCYLLKENVSTVPGLPQDLKDMYTAEADFLIALYHFYIVRSYGPVILVKNLVDINDLGTPESFLSRTPYDECVAWIAEQLKNAAYRLPDRWTGADYGRATKIAAMSIRARMLLYAASPQFNGGDKFRSLYGNFKNPDGTQLISTTYDSQKWKTAAAAYKEAIDLAKNAGYDLYRATNGALPRTPEPTNLVQRSLRFTFIDKETTPEVIWGFCGVENPGNGLQSKSMPRWGQICWGGLSPTLLQVERFYTKKGLPIDEDPAFSYPNRFDIASFDEDDENGEGETLKMNLGREPRFYAWIAFHNGYYEVLGEDKDTQSENSYKAKYKRGINDAKQLVQFTKLANMGLTSDNTWGTKTGYLNKKGASPGTSVTAEGIKLDRYPWPLVRLGELYLGYAEACVESNDLSTAKTYLNYVRDRAGIPDVEESWEGVAALDQDKLREIVRRERLNELYLENHNFWDIRRWGVAETMNEQPKGLSVRETTLENFAKPVTVDVQRRFIPAHYLMPIEIKEVNKNPNLVQNPGYADVE